MAEMAAAMSGAHLGPSHAVARISVLDNIFGPNRLRKARPTRAAVELVHRSEQRLARDGVHVNAGLLVVPISVVKWPFRSVTLGHAVLLGRKTGYGVWILAVVRHYVYDDG